MNGPALRYTLRREGRAPLELAVPGGGTQRLSLPDSEARRRLLNAVLRGRAGRNETLELLGERVEGMKARARERLRHRVGVLTPEAALMSNLNAWENIALPAVYHSLQPVERIARTTREVLESLGIEPRAFLSRLPDDLTTFERRLAAFLRLLVAEPALALIDALARGLNREETTRAARFEAEYRSRQPAGTLVYLELAQEEVS